MTSCGLRQKFLNFFKSKGHKILPSASLIPENDPTVLFTTAGMHPLVPYLLGEKHPLGNKLASCQKCIRTSDIGEVGDDWHLTFFEMLGNWSLDSYWKKEAMNYSWEFLTDKKWLGIDEKLLTASVFEEDQETYNLWLEKLPARRIVKLGKKDNWWGPAGKTGPCGPCTEIFYKGVEIWNNVFMEYNQISENKFELLKQKNVDTGMGLERTVAVLSGKSSVYEIDVFQGLIKDTNQRDSRIIADHLKAAVFISADGIVPSNLEQGYVLRRLIRTAIAKGARDVDKFAELIIKNYQDIYPELKQKEILVNLKDEEKKFSQTLDKALKEYKKLAGQKKISGHDAFILFATYGLPFDVMREKVDEKEFQKELIQHQELSRTATTRKFKSGLADNSEIVIKLHTAAHLLLQAIRQVLGKEIMQKGSNITAERLRLDFNFSRKLTEEEIKKIEDLVNEKIKDEIEVKCEEMPPAEAMKKGALGAFGHKYGDIVKVYSIGDFSKEICAGPHVGNTRELGSFKILKEESSSSGVRRIKAVVE